MSRWGDLMRVTSVSLSICAAACSPQQQKRPVDDSGGGNAAASAPLDNGSAATPTKSILRPDTAEPTSTATPSGPIDMVVGFDESGNVLTDQAKAMLDGLAGSQVVQAGGAFTLRGHSDSRGSDRANLRASRRRAEAVRDYLVGKNIDPERITVIALGETTPAVPNALPDGRDDPVARQKNRRVEVHVAVPMQAPAPPTDNPASTNEATPTP